MCIPFEHKFFLVNVQPLSWHIPRNNRSAYYQPSCSTLYFTFFVVVAAVVALFQFYLSLFDCQSLEAGPSRIELNHFMCWIELYENICITHHSIYRCISTLIIIWTSPPWNRQRWRSSKFEYLFLVSFFFFGNIYKQLTDDGYEHNCTFPRLCIFVSDSKLYHSIITCFAFNRPYQTFTIFLPQKRNKFSIHCHALWKWIQSKNQNKIVHVFYFY